MTLGEFGSQRVLVRVAVTKPPTEMNQQPLAGIRLVDLTHALAGPYCTYLLGLLGAEIIKVEIPGGEMGRWMAPPGPLRDAGLGAAFLAQAAGKRMLAVDIRKPDGAEILRRPATPRPAASLRQRHRRCKQSQREVLSGGSR
jgi:CoA-transferase family III